MSKISNNVRVTVNPLDVNDILHEISSNEINDVIDSKKERKQAKRKEEAK